MKGIVAQFILALRHRLESVGCYVGVGPFSSVVLISLHVALFVCWDGILGLTRLFCCCFVLAIVDGVFGVRGSVKDYVLRWFPSKNLERKSTRR